MRARTTSSKGSSPCFGRGTTRSGTCAQDSGENRGLERRRPSAGRDDLAVLRSHRSHPSQQPHRVSQHHLRHSACVPAPHARFRLYHHRALIFAVALIIPFALLTAFVGMRMFGATPNLISLGAVDFGIIVETAIFAAEAVIFAIRGKMNREIGTIAEALERRSRSGVALRRPPCHRVRADPQSSESRRENFQASWDHADFGAGRGAAGGAHFLFRCCPCSCPWGIRSRRHWTRFLTGRSEPVFRIGRRLVKISGA